MTTTRRRQIKPTRTTEGDGSPRLITPLDGPSFSGCTPAKPVLIAVPNHRGDFKGKQAYVWVGDDEVLGCFGTIPVDRFLALADAIRAAGSDRTDP